MHLIYTCLLAIAFGAMLLPFASVHFRKPEPLKSLKSPEEIARLERELLITPEARIEDTDTFIREADLILNPPTEMQRLEEKVLASYRVPPHQLARIRPIDSLHFVEMEAPSRSQRFRISHQYTRTDDTVEYSVQTEYASSRAEIEEFLQQHKNNPWLQVLQVFASPWDGWHTYNVIVCDCDHPLRETQDSIKCPVCRYQHGPQIYSKSPVK